MTWTPLVANTLQNTIYKAYTLMGFGWHLYKIRKFKELLRFSDNIEEITITNGNISLYT